MRRELLVAVLALPILGAVLGRLAGPFFARANSRVKLAAEVWQEEAAADKPGERSLQSQAFHAKARPKAALFAEAQRVQRQFRLGGTLFGLWCGLVAAAKLFALARPKQRDMYEIDHAHCVVCTRCFESCPRERLRRGLTAVEGQSPAAVDP